MSGPRGTNRLLSYRRDGEKVKIMKMDFRAFYSYKGTRFTKEFCCPEDALAFGLQHHLPVKVYQINGGLVCEQEYSHMERKMGDEWVSVVEYLTDNTISDFVLPKAEARQWYATDKKFQQFLGASGNEAKFRTLSGVRYYIW